MTAHPGARAKLAAVIDPGTHGSGTRSWSAGRLSRPLRVRFRRRHARALATVRPRFGADLVDQSQLYGLLNRLRDFGIELVSVNAGAEACDAG